MRPISREQTLFVASMLFSALSFMVMAPACRGAEIPPATQQAAIAVSEPVGGETEVAGSGKKLVLSYDLEATIAKAISTEWSCKCEVQETITINDKRYTIFGDCKSQKGNQLIELGDKYYLISKKLVVRGSSEPAKSKTEKRE